MPAHCSDPVVMHINDRISEMSFIPNDDHHCEPLRVLHYDSGQYFQGHLDVHAAPGRAKSSRVATCYIYLSNVEAGGETYFPLAQKAGGGRDPVPKTCAGLDGIAGRLQPNESNFVQSVRDQIMQLGVTIRPKKGRAVLWWNKAQDGEVDWRSRHVGCPVVVGEKWGAVRWMHHRDHP